MNDNNNNRDIPILYNGNEGQNQTCQLPTHRQTQKKNIYINILIESYVYPENVYDGILDVSTIQ